MMKRSPYCSGYLIHYNSWGIIMNFFSNFDHIILMINRGLFRAPSARLLHELGKVGATALLAAIAAPLLAAGDIVRPPRSEEAPEVRLTEKVVTLPIVMVREFPFIEGSAAGVSGKFMLDTGIESALSINDHRVPVTDARTIGKGFFGSGQTFEIHLVPEVRDVHIAALSYPSVTRVTSKDSRLLENDITPDFIGWFGYTAFANYAMKLDYRTLRATFYRQGEADYLMGERVIAELPFETRKLPNIPIMPGSVGDIPVITDWDTGQYGIFYTSEEGKARLLKEGRLTPSKEKPDRLDLHGWELNGHPMPDLKGIEVKTTPFPAAAPIGITEPDVLSLGYNILSQFKTVWDYPGKRIYLLAR